MCKNSYKQPTKGNKDRWDKKNDEMFRLDSVIVIPRMKLFSSSVRKTELGVEFREYMKQCTRSLEMHYN